MADDSHLDSKYFLDQNTYNCPFCNRKNLPYSNESYISFNWSEKKQCYVYVVSCSYCKKRSAHFSYKSLYSSGLSYFRGDIELDEEIFHSQPSSFFVMDERIPSILKELITEAEQCQKMNYLTGASACMRKAIYEFLVLEKIPFVETIEKDDQKQEVNLSYKKRIKLLEEKHSSIDSEYFDILADIQGMTSDKIHEQSWDQWDSKTIKFLLETLKTILDEMYVAPEKKKERNLSIRALKEAISGKKKETNKAVQKSATTGGKI